MVLSINVTRLSLLRDQRQITFVTLHGFCPLSIHQSPHPLLLTDNIKFDGIKTKIKWKQHAHFNCISSFEKVLLWKVLRYSCQFFYFSLFEISFYIRRYNSYNFLELEKVFVTSCPFLTDLPKPSHLLNGQNPLSVIKISCWCSLNERNKNLH